MKTMREGLGRMWRENPLIVILLLIGTALCIWRVAAGRYDTLLQTLLPVACLIGLARTFYHRGTMNDAAGAPSQTKLSEETDLSLQVTGLVLNDEWSLSPIGAGQPPVKRCSVVFETRTGAPIRTDTSHRMERRLRGVWRTVEPLTDAPEHWEALEIPEGKSEKIPIPSAAGYANLRMGYYRMVKTVQTARGERTVAGEFALDLPGEM